jgi:hypothetical protein
MSDKNHPINQKPKRPSAKASDWDSGVPEVPSKPDRPLVQPDNSNRRAPHGITVTSIESPAGKAVKGDAYAAHTNNSAIANPSPKKL